ncbi:unnamed protein product [Penicillium salamii]|uniref:Uncharacterized protein n=1 Tax=Penicillium salamii TaxID=1612424 RepID=A0A9W4NMM3_9EURO|nr:unnamed protein product [Penicillium salamii]
MLLNRGVDVNVHGGEYGNSFQAACSGGYAKIAQMLLGRGVDVHVQGGEYGNALQAARRGGYHHIVELLQRQHCADLASSKPPHSRRLKASL